MVAVVPHYLAGFLCEEEKEILIPLLRLSFCVWNFYRQIESLFLKKDLGAKVAAT
jgi:hypothetical protein